LDKHEGTDFLGDTREHAFALEGSWGVVVDAVRLCQRGRNGLGGSLIQPCRFELSGGLVGAAEVIGDDCHSPATRASVGSQSLPPDAAPVTIPVAEGRRTDAGVVDPAETTVPPRDAPADQCWHDRWG
jgi:hypothetical protein